MKLATTTGDFGWYVKTHEECIKLIYDAGFRYIDFSIGGNRFLENDNWREETLKIKAYAEGLDVKFVQAHAIDGNPLDLKRVDKLVEQTNRSIEICKILEIPQIVVHAGYRKGASKEEFYEGNLEFYKRLFPTMEKTGVNVLTENTGAGNLRPENFYFYRKGNEMLEFIKYVNHPLFHAVWDTGHGNTEGNQYEDIMDLGDELYGIHVHDNSEYGDEHTMPYFGTLNLDAVMNGLIDSGYKGYFTFEVLGALRLSGNRYGKRHTFERDMRLLEPTLEMQIDMERLLYTIGKHCLTSYGVFEE